MQAPGLFFFGAGLIGLGSRAFCRVHADCRDDAGGERRGGQRAGARRVGRGQATAAGLAIALGGGMRDIVGHFALAGTWGEALATPATGYSVVYHLEIAIIFITLIVLGPLVRHGVQGARTSPGSGRMGLADFPT